MDRDQEEMQFLGLFDIYFESYKVIYRCRKIFSHITLSLILPLAIIFLAHKEVSQLIFSNLHHAEFQLHRARPGSTSYDRLSDHISSDRALLVAFKVAYLTFLLVFSLLSTSAVVYTVACAYTSRDLSFHKVISVVPKVWKRLMVTFLSIFLVFFIYNIVACIAFVLFIVTALIFASDDVAQAVFWLGLAVYTILAVYMSIVWQLANTISVLEDLYGFKAMSKSKELLKGKMVMAVVFFLKLHFSILVVDVIFKKFVLYGRGVGVLGRVGFGILCLVVLFKLILFGLVAQTVIYLVCKSYHHENIDKSALSDHLEIYLGEYVPLKSKDVQMEDYQV